MQLLHAGRRSREPRSQVGRRDPHLRGRSNSSHRASNRAAGASAPQDSPTVRAPRRAGAEGCSSAPGPLQSGAGRAAPGDPRPGAGPGGGLWQPAAEEQEAPGAAPRGRGLRGLPARRQALEAAPAGSTCAALGRPTPDPARRPPAPGRAPQGVAASPGPSRTSPGRLRPRPPTDPLRLRCPAPVTPSPPAPRPRPLARCGSGPASPRPAAQRRSPAGRSRLPPAPPQPPVATEQRRRSPLPAAAPVPAARHAHPGRLLAALPVALPWDGRAALPVKAPAPPLSAHGPPECFIHSGALAPPLHSAVPDWVKRSKGRAAIGCRGCQLRPWARLPARG